MRLDILARYSHFLQFGEKTVGIRMNPDRSPFLGRCQIIDWNSTEVQDLASRLARDETCTVAVAKRCFEWVRDNIKHSLDFQLNPVTCRATDVLLHGTGYCYSKSHLLCALLRANQIPAGLCYQRLSVDDSGKRFCLHGLNAVFLPAFGWYRIDPRGNRHDINAQFTPPAEKLAFSMTMPGEYDLPQIHDSPLPVVIDALRAHRTWDELSRNLPDMNGYNGR